MTYQRGHGLTDSERPLESVFRFWGFEPTAYEELVGVGRAINGASLPTAIPVFGRVVFNKRLSERLRSAVDGALDEWRSWLLIDPNHVPIGKALAWLQTEDGRRYPIITRSENTGYDFLFDLDRTIRFLQNEQHLTHTPPLYVRLGINPHRLPRRLRDFAFHGMHTIRQMRGSKGTIGQGVAGVDVWRLIVSHLVEDCSVIRPMPFWPNGKSYACCLSHDLDTKECFLQPRLLNMFRSIDEDGGARAGWMVVTDNLGAGRPALDDLHAAGHEIGFHGTTHDHRLAFLSPVETAKRVAEVQQLIEAYGTSGMRSPAYLRSPLLFRSIDGILQYDMSMHDSIEGVCRPSPTNEGCGSCHPFFLCGTNVLELPTTVPEDWQFDLRGITDVASILSTQLDRVARIKRRGGVASVLTHAEPPPTTKPFMVEAYRQLVSHLAADSSVWLTTPSAINQWWRQRWEAIDRLWSAPSRMSQPTSTVRGKARLMETASHAVAIGPGRYRRSYRLRRPA